MSSRESRFLYGIYCKFCMYISVTERPEHKNVTGLLGFAENSTMEVDVERCPFRPQRQKQEDHMLLAFVTHLMLKTIGARGSCRGEIKFLAPKVYLLA
jgi:hypothetical protein